MSKKSYQLSREGNGRTLVHSHPTARSAFQSIGHSICDNGYGTKADAQRFAATVKTDGTPAIFGPYTFILTQVS
jgi:hypothetical protein